ncbi:hypothetical protein [Desulfovirgula thermocuniculi]|uniref:hypothetical protein n=1 Tax=Desulfovirgula thermocuniculi TaxID=348842 RepID=UPI00040D25D0|nr:hypothetical protein [Desulfovirgula thermocuniculi]
MRCPVCGKELTAGPEEQIVRFVPGAALDLRSLDWEEQAYFHSPCGWVVVKLNGVKPGMPAGNTGRREGV